jgi:hypothetical protein
VLNYLNDFIEIDDDRISGALNDLRLCGLLSSDVEGSIQIKLRWIARSINSLTNGIVDFLKKARASTVDTEQLHISNEETDKDNGQKDDNRTMKVTTDVLVEILKLAGISAKNTDKTQIANLIGYLTGYSNEAIRKRLSNTEELTRRHKTEVDKINQILENLNIQISIKYNNNR